MLWHHYLGFPNELYWEKEKNAHAQLFSVGENKISLVQTIVF